MADYQVAWKASTHQAVVQSKGDALPVGYTKAGEFVHTHATDPEGADVNHVFYHHVRDVLHPLGFLNMQEVSFTVDTDYIALVSFVITPATVTLDAEDTQQLGITKTPSDASNGTVTWVSSDPTKATVSASGLVTAVATGTSTITATSEDGGLTATRTVTVN